MNNLTRPGFIAAILSFVIRGGAAALLESRGGKNKCHFHTLKVNYASLLPQASFPPARLFRFSLSF